MQPPNRRQFLVRSGMALGLASKVIHPDSLTSALEEPQGPAAGSGIERPGQLSGSHAPLYNKNLRTAIGLGDEPAGIVDKFGQVLRSRNAACESNWDRRSSPPKKSSGHNRSLMVTSRSSRHTSALAMLPCTCPPSLLNTET